MAELRDLTLSLDQNAIASLLSGAGLRMEPDVRAWCGLFEGDALVACGGYATEGPVIKCLAVQEGYRGEGLQSALVSHLYTRLRREGAKNVFLYTKPENISLFRTLGFYLVAAGEDAALLESNRRGLDEFLAKIQAEAFAAPCAGPVGAVIMNANPFTLGHQHLLEHAAKVCGRLYVFVVEADASAFTTAERLMLVRSGSKHLKNAVVIGGGPYMISAATFPSYFIKDPKGAAPAHAALDAALFAKRIAPALHITRRFCGEEPLDALTRLYNQTLTRVLPPQGVAVHILPRLCEGGAPVSASRVRACIQAGDMASLRGLLPLSTLDFFETAAGQAALARIRRA